MNYNVTCIITYSMTKDNSNYNSTFLNNFAIKITSFFSYWMIENYYILQFWKITAILEELIILILFEIDSSAISSNTK